MPSVKTGVPANCQQKTRRAIRTSNSHLRMNRHKSRVSVKQAMMQIRMPNAECRKKPEASVDRLAPLGSPSKPAKSSATGAAGWMGGNTSDFGFRNSFGFRLSEFGFHDSKPLDFHNENC